MKLEIEEILNDPEESFKLRVFDGEPGCMDDYWHIHPEYEIVYVHNGAGRRHVGTHISTYENGVLLFLGPNIPHLPLSNQSEPDNFEVVVQFSQELLDQRVAAFPEFGAIAQLGISSQRGLSFGKETRSTVSSYIKPADNFSSADKLIWLFRLLNDLAMAKDVFSLNAYGISLSRHQSEHQRLKLIFKRIAEGFRDEIPLDELADQVGLTKNSLCRFFKKVTGQTIIDYLNEYRIAMAKEQLKKDDLSVSEILYKCGFNDPSFFYKKFKQLNGMSPKEFRVGFTDPNRHRQKIDRIHPHY